jgi:hypothetical protein
MKLGLLTASLVLVAGGAVGCGDDSGSGSGSADGGGGGSEGTSTEDFCGAFQTFAEGVAGLTGEEENLGEILKEEAQEIVDVGTPDDIPDDAKDGLQLTLDAIEDLPDDASAADMEKLEEDFSEEDTEKSEAFSTYLEETCPDLGESGGSGDSGSESGGGSDAEPSESGDGS